MPNYKKMYRKLHRANEKALRALVEAQRVCEELYRKDPEPDLPDVVALNQEEPDEDVD